MNAIATIDTVREAAEQVLGASEALYFRAGSERDAMCAMLASALEAQAERLHEAADSLERTLSSRG